jgi:hypothetical protein
LGARAAQLFWLAVVSVAAAGIALAATGDGKIAVTVALAVFITVGVVIVIRPFQREDWETFWERVGDSVWWW